MAHKNHRRVELSSSVLLQTWGKLRSLQGTELSPIVVICLLGSLILLTLNSRCVITVIVKCESVYSGMYAIIFKAVLKRLYFR